jgi:hypothetical protein
MTWEDRLLGFLDDLEQRAEGLALTNRDAEVAELGRAEYAEITLVSRLHASLGRELQLSVRGAGIVRGRLLRVGAGWCLLAIQGNAAAPGHGQPSAGPQQLVALGAVVTVRGLSPAAITQPARSPLGRLGVGSVLREVAESRESVVLVDVDGVRRRGTVGRVGADFLELTGDDGGLEVLPFGALAVVRTG